MQSSTKRLAVSAMLTALALIFSYIEFLIPISIGLPGIKLGLANIVVVIALYIVGPLGTLAINVVRILLSALLFGNMFSAFYALAGGMLSFLVMYSLQKTKAFSVVGVSMAGGAFHNIGQLMLAMLIVGSSKVFLYLPVLLFCGMATGIINGIISTLVLRRLK